ncbi:MAG: hypothetical protein Q9169_008404, partial [Polycauliona sp. 2 TL-2023]
YCLDVEIPSDIMHDEDMRSIWATANIIIYAMNDIFSLPKELAQSQVDSLIPLLYERYGTLEAAMDRAQEMLDESIAAFELAAERLLVRYAEDEGLQLKLQQFIHGCQCACTANVNWSLDTGRYKLPRTSGGEMVVRL